MSREPPCPAKGCHRTGAFAYHKDHPRGTLILYYCDEHHPERVAERARAAQDVRIVHALRRAIPDVCDPVDRERAMWLLDELLPDGGRRG